MWLGSLAQVCRVRFSYDKLVQPGRRVLSEVEPDFAMFPKEDARDGPALRVNAPPLPPK
jgi:hypothetical protein